MAKPPPKKRNGPPPGKRGPAPAGDDAPPPPKKQVRGRKRSWPFIVVMFLVWGLIFGAVIFSHFLSGLPDIRNLMARGPQEDVTILDDRGHLVARRGLTQGELADRLGMDRTGLNQIIHGKRAVTPSTALRLAKALGTTPEYWLNAQLAIDLYRASHDELEIAALAKIRPLPDRRTR